MTLQERIQTWLGINDLRQRIKSLESTIERLNTTHNQYRQVTNRAFGRIIAKVDPIYGKDELSKERIAESDRIGEEVMRRLLSEHVESNKYGGNS
jgi:uncharacterized small protein (DUF1192 family)